MDCHTPSSIPGTFACIALSRRRRYASCHHNRQHAKEAKTNQDCKQGPCLACVPLEKAACNTKCCARGTFVRVFVHAFFFLSAIGNIPWLCGLRTSSPSATRGRLRAAACAQPRLRHSPQPSLGPTCVEARATRGRAGGQGEIRHTHTHTHMEQRQTQSYIRAYEKCEGSRSWKLMWRKHRFLVGNAQHGQLTSDAGASGGVLFAASIVQFASMFPRLRLLPCAAQSGACLSTGKRCG